MNEAMSAELLAALGNRYLDSYECHVGHMYGERGDSIAVWGEVSGYTVYINPDEATCSCPDFITRKRLCKHLIAAVVSGNLKGALSEMEVCTLLLNRKDVA
ncbi:MAG: SWIM zinc finger domain-containing protein [Dehalococcoidales bacterium]|jgi:predicted nucleic acid-binding Zn finger protein|nr:SWIM zinc finger domain-containing protein [Sphaerochaeta sp.]MDD5510720.1 SWIM zinc finger domain-containing protein [Dehalococcoidales bacterium]